MTQVHIVQTKGKRKILKRLKPSEIKNNLIEGFDGRMLDSQHELISMLLPPAVKAFFVELESEVTVLCGNRYSQGTPMQRWGSQPGSITMGNQHVAIGKPRVRDEATGQEVPLVTYARFQDPSRFDATVFQDGIKHVSQRDYEKGLPKIAASFGVSKSTVSRSWIKTTTKQVEKLLKRDIGGFNIVAVFIDGKRFAKRGVVVALGVGADGRKHVLGIYQSSTENSAACTALLADLEQRGLPTEKLLFVVDGGSGLNKALEDKYQVANPEKRRAYRLRCYIHKWHNLSDVLDENGRNEAASLFWAMRDAKDMIAAKACSDALEACLRKHNVSALNSYLEAKDDLLAIHRLQLSKRLKTFFSTTNPIESLNFLLEEDLRRVKRWHNSEQFQRWLATACLQNEKRMHRISGYSGMPALIVRLSELCCHQEIVDNNTVAA
jgi:transposase-like protein